MNYFSGILRKCATEYNEKRNNTIKDDGKLCPRSWELQSLSLVIRVVFFSLCLFIALRHKYNVVPYITVCIVLTHIQVIVLFMRLQLPSIDIYELEGNICCISHNGTEYTRVHNVNLSTALLRSFMNCSSHSNNKSTGLKEIHVLFAFFSLTHKFEPWFWLDFVQWFLNSFRIYWKIFTINSIPDIWRKKWSTSHSAHK